MWTVSAAEMYVAQLHVATVPIISCVQASNARNSAVEKFQGQLTTTLRAASATLRHQAASVTQQLA